MHRRRLLLTLVASALVLPLAARAAGPVIEVFKTPTCGCCKEWVRHLEANGFAVTVREVSDTAPYRAKAGIPEQFGSCHTGMVQGYAIEGHVPAREIKRLLASKPRATGLAVPGMPMGSPGMEGPQSMPYDVLLVGKDGRSSVFQRYR